MLSYSMHFLRSPMVLSYSMYLLFVSDDAQLQYVLHSHALTLFLFKVLFFSGPLGSWMIVCCYAPLWRRGGILFCLCWSVGRSVGRPKWFPIIILKTITELSYFTCWLVLVRTRPLLICKHGICSWELFITQLLYFTCWLVLVRKRVLMFLCSLGQRSRLHGSRVINYVNSFYWTS